MGRSEEESVAIIRRAIDLGVNLIDTAEAYGTEAVVGRAVAEAAGSGIDRTSLVISSKKQIRQGGETITAAQFQTGLDMALGRLRTDYIDVYHLHGVPASLYDRCVGELVPAMQKARDQGKIRYLGITEGFASDTRHAMLRRAVADPHWDVIMVGFNILNPSARHTVLEPASKRGIGVLNMFAVRRALSQPAALRELVGELIARGEIDAGAVERDNPLDFLLDAPDTPSVVDAAYRFCRDEPGIHVVLSGTGNRDHLEANVRALQGPPLPHPIRRRLMAVFSGVDSVSGQ